MKTISYRLAGLATASAASLLLWGGAVLTTTVVSELPQAAAQSSPSPQAINFRKAYAQILLSLGLSDQQKAAIRSLRQTMHDQNQGVTDPVQRRANMEKMHAQIENVLTPAQRKQYDPKVAALRAEMKAQMHDSPHQ